MGSRPTGYRAVAAGVIVSVSLACSAPVVAQSALFAPFSSIAGVPLEPQGPDTYRWVGHEREIEEFLAAAPIDRMTDIPVGITKPRRAHFAPGGPAGSMAWKPLPKGLLHGRMESYTSEIAAYRLSRALGMDMVPPAVERKVGGVKGAAIYWIDGVKPWDPAQVPQAPGARWSRQTSRMLLFDQLIANIDRNRGNLLLDEAGRIYLIDHSRAFTTQTILAGLKGPQQIDRALWARMEALTRADLDAILRPWLSASQIDALMARRHRIRKGIDTSLRERGELFTFLPDARAERPRLAEAHPH